MRLLPTDRFSPYVLAGVGVTSRGPLNELQRWGATPHAVVGAGLEYQMKSRWSVTGGISARFFLSDNLDGATVGKYNDNATGLQAGIIYQLNNPARRAKAAAKPQ